MWRIRIRVLLAWFLEDSDEATIPFYVRKTREMGFHGQPPHGPSATHFLFLDFLKLVNKLC